MFISASSEEAGDASASLAAAAATIAADPFKKTRRPASNWQSFMCALHQRHSAARMIYPRLQPSNARLREKDCVGVFYLSPVIGGNSPERSGKKIRRIRKITAAYPIAFSAKKTSSSEI